jgi:hypothetical protein
MPNNISRRVIHNYGAIFVERLHIKEVTAKSLNDTPQGNPGRFLRGSIVVIQPVDGVVFDGELV